MSFTFFEDIQKAFWFWGRQIFSWWGIIIALCIFLPVGFLIGFNVKQPSLANTSTQTLLSSTLKIESFLVSAESRGTRDLKVDSFKAKVEATRMLAKRAPKPLQESLQKQLTALSVEADDMQEMLRTQTAEYDKQIDENQQKIRSLRKTIEQQVTANTDLRSVIYDQLKRFLKWIGAVSFLTIVLAALFILALFNPSIRRIIARTGSISAFGVSFNFNDLQSVRASITVREQELEKDIVAAYLGTLKRSHLEKQFRTVMADIIRVFQAAGVDMNNTPHRATLFVPGFVGQELVQATLYFGNWGTDNEKVVGRRFSVRFGIIGKAWRLQSSQYYPHINNDNKNLLRNWGFTQSELPQSGGGTHGCLMAFCINDSVASPPLGIIYIEAQGADKLHPVNWPSTLSADKLVEDATGLPDGSGMTTADKFADENIWQEVNQTMVSKLREQLTRLQKEFRWNDKIQQAIGR